MIYVLVTVLLLFLSFRYDICGKRRDRELLYNIVLIIFILVAGLRYRVGVDTISYVNKFYHLYPDLDNFSSYPFTLGDDVLYILLNSVVKYFGGKFYVVQLLVSSFVNVLIFKYFKKHTRYIFTCVTFYFILFYFHLCFEIMRASMAVAICLFANDYFFERKYFKACVLYLFAFLFHAQTIVLIITPLLFFLKMNKTSILVLFIAFALGLYLQSSFGDYFAFLDMVDIDSTLSNKANHVAESNLEYANKRNINYFMFRYLPMVLTLLFSLWYLKNHCKSLSPKIETLAMVGLFFFILHTSIYILYRIVDYYKIHFVILFSECFINLIVRTGGRNLNFSIVKATFIFLPVLGMSTIEIINSGKYYPYSSVIDRSIDKDKEKVFRETRMATYYYPYSDEY